MGRSLILGSWGPYIGCHEVGHTIGLRSKSLALGGSDVPGTEVPDWVKGLNRPDIYRTIGTDGALPLEDGSVSDVVYEFDMPRWRIDLAGQKLDTIVTRVMAAAEPTAP